MKTSRKDAIISAALSCFTEKGVAETSMAEVAARAEVDPPLIHYYFPNQEVLMAEVVGKVLEDLKEASLAPLKRKIQDPEKVLVEYVKAPFLWAEKNPGKVSIWTYFYYLATFRDRFRELNSSIREVGRERISVILYRGVEAGAFEVQKKQSVPELATMIQGLITGNAILFMTEKDPPKEIVQWTLNSIRMWLSLKLKSDLR